MITLRELAEVLLAARVAARAATVVLDEKRLAFELENAPLIQAKAEVEKHLADADGALRAFALAEYRDTGNKAPGPGVEIKMVTHLIYDPDQALTWAISKGVACSLDRRSFEKLAKVLPMDFVKISEKPTVTVAQDLVKALGLKEKP